MPLTGDPVSSGAVPSSTAAGTPRPSLATAPPLPYASLLVRGLAAGAVAGVAAALVGLLVVAAPIRSALAVEAARPAEDAGGHEEMFSRGVQVVGGAAAAVVVGVALGALFATAFAAAYGRLPGATDFGRSVALAAVCLAAAGVLPAVKYPANPPGIGDPDTVSRRTILYLTLIVSGFLIAYGALWLHRFLAARTAWSASVRSTVTAAATAAAVVVILVAWPSVPVAVSADVPAQLLWNFRLASLAELLTMWAVLGFAFGLTVERAADRARSAAVPA